MEYKFLNESSIEQIYECWIESFKDYHVDMSYMTIDRMIQRGKMDRVDYNYSVGAFSENEMVGFLLIGVDKINNKLNAFDAGTGVIPEYRGKGIAGGMFDFALSKLKEKEISVFSLEVIQENKAAIKAYQKSGFEIRKDYNCYKLELDKLNSEFQVIENLSYKLISKDELFNCLSFLEWEISWEYNASAINEIYDDLKIIGAFINDEWVGFLVYYPVLEWIFTIGVKEEYRDEKIEHQLVLNLSESIKTDTQIIKFNNIPPKNRMNKILEDLGFEIYIKQYEMFLEL